jgi:hypothetical protein
MNLDLKTAILSAAFIASSASADDLGKSKQILCSIQNVNVCQSDGVCAAVLPADLNIPQFIEIDTKTGRLSTTAASGENRETTASQVIRADDHLLIHGDQLGRAFSLLIQESTGQASFASVKDGNATVVFSACTPKPD